MAFHAKLIIVFHVLQKQFSSRRWRGSHSYKLLDESIKIQTWRSWFIFKEQDEIFGREVEQNRARRYFLLLFFNLHTFFPFGSISILIEIFLRCSCCRTCECDGSEWNTTACDEDGDITSHLNSEGLQFHPSNRLWDVLSRETHNENLSLRLRSIYAPLRYVNCYTRKLNKQTNKPRANSPP